MSDLKTKISNFFSRMFKKLRKEQETFTGGQVSAQTKEDLMKPIYPVDVYSDDPWADPIPTQEIKQEIKIMTTNNYMREELRRVREEAINHYSTNCKYKNCPTCKYKGQKTCALNMRLDYLIDHNVFVLPCEPGTIVYEIYQFCGDGDFEVDHHEIKLEDLPKINKTVFLDKNKAEEIIEKLEAGEISFEELEK